VLTRKHAITCLLILVIAGAFPSSARGEYQYHREFQLALPINGTADPIRVPIDFACDFEVQGSEIALLDESGYAVGSPYLVNIQIVGPPVGPGFGSSEIQVVWNGVAWPSPYLDPGLFDASRRPFIDLTWRRAEPGMPEDGFQVRVSVPKSAVQGNRDWFILVSASSQAGSPPIGETVRLTLDVEFESLDPDRELARVPLWVLALQELERSGRLIQLDFPESWSRDDLAIRAFMRGRAVSVWGGRAPISEEDLRKLGGSISAEGHNPSASNAAIEELDFEDPNYYEAWLLDQLVQEANAEHAYVSAVITYYEAMRAAVARLVEEGAVDPASAAAITSGLTEYLSELQRVSDYMSENGRAAAARLNNILN